MKATTNMILAAAVADGKIPTAETNRYRDLLDGPQGKAYRHLLTASVEQGGLAKNLVINEGAVPAGLGGPESYPSEWVERPRRSGPRLLGEVEPGHQRPPRVEVEDKDRSARGERRSRVQQEP